MKLSDLVTQDRILPQLAAKSKVGVLEEMVGLLCSCGALDKQNAPDVEQALMQRETLGTTGIGKGIALPHAKHAGVKVTDLIRDDDLCSFMRRAEDGAELMELLREADERFGG